MLVLSNTQGVKKYVSRLSKGCLTGSALSHSYSASCPKSNTGDQVDQLLNQVKMGVQLILSAETRMKKKQREKAVHRELFVSIRTAGPFFVISVPLACRWCFRGCDRIHALISTHFGSFTHSHLISVLFFWFQCRETQSQSVMEA